MNLMTEVGTILHQKDGPPRLHPYGKLIGTGQRRDGGIERVYSVKHLREMPRCRRVRSVFLYPFMPVEKRLVIVRVDGDRYSLPGGRVELCDTSLEAAGKREFGQEAQGEIIDYKVLGFSEVFPARAKPYIAVYFTVRVVRLDPFVVSDESDERYEATYDCAMLDCLMGSPHENTEWVCARTKLLLTEAMRRGRHLPKEAKPKKKRK